MLSLMHYRLAGAAGTTVTCPLEVIKTRLQTAMGQNVMKTLQAGYRLMPNTATSSAIAMHSTSTTATSTPMVYLRYVKKKKKNFFHQMGCFCPLVHKGKLSLV